MQSIRGKEPNWYEKIKKEIEIKYTKKGEKKNPWTCKEEPTKGSWVVEKEQTGNYIGRISSVKGNEAIINHWVEDRNTRTVKPCEGCHRNRTPDI